MNIARSLDKPVVPRSKKRRRTRRLKTAFHVFIFVAFLVSAGIMFYWTAVGIGMLWHMWGLPAYDTVSGWLLGLSSAERFMWLNRLGWGAVSIGLLTGLWVYKRPSRFARWVTIICFTYCYIFLWYGLWLVSQSFFRMSGWTENGLIGLAILCFVYIISQTRMTRVVSSEEE